MGLYLQPDLQDAVPLASNLGWGDLRKWVASLPAGEFIALRRLCAFSWSGEVKKLQQDLATALKDHAPEGTVKTTAADLLETLRGLGPIEVVSVTDGMGADQVA